jgi:hypothetical protein
VKAQMMSVSTCSETTEPDGTDDFTLIFMRP